ncbi:hypothetical protein Tco_0671056, partial [Tanacetum coccineum]
MQGLIVGKHCFSKESQYPKDSPSIHCRALYGPLRWIMETFPISALYFYYRGQIYPRGIAQFIKKQFYRTDIKEFFDLQFDSAIIPSEILTPDHIEVGMPWWVHSRAYFYGSAPPVVIPPLALKHIGQFGRAFNTSPSLSFFDNLVTPTPHGFENSYKPTTIYDQPSTYFHHPQTTPSHTPDDGGDDVTYIGQQFTTDFPTMYNVDPRK